MASPVEPPEVVFFNLQQRWALLNTDDVIPITDFYTFADETNDPDKALCFIAGDGRWWFKVWIRDFPKVTLQ